MTPLRALALLLVCAGTVASRAETPAPAASVTPAEPTLAQALAHVHAAAAAAKARIQNSTTLREEEKILLREDLAFSDDAGLHGAAASFAPRMAAEGKLFPNNAPILFGPAAAHALFANDTGRWVWAPLDVVASGDTGTTWGIAVISFNDEKGQDGFLQTRYVTVWRKDAAGAWKIWADLGNRGPAPTAPFKN